MNCIFAASKKSCAACKNKTSPWWKFSTPCKDLIPIFYKADKIKPNRVSLFILGRSSNVTALVVSQSDYFAPVFDRLLYSKGCINQTLEFWSFSIISPAGPFQILCETWPQTTAILKSLKLTIIFFYFFFITNSNSISKSNDNFSL